MRKTRIEKGITLISLIITIVVLLVLATVAISSIQNDGIISKAQDIANKFNQAQSNEQGILDEYLSYLEGDSGVPEELEKYILGPNKTGRPVTEVLDTSTGKPKDETSTIPNASTAITILGEDTNADSTKGILYIKYKGKKYEVVADLSTYYTESIKCVGNNNPDLPEGSIVFSGELTFEENENFARLDLDFAFLLTNDYLLEFEIDGEKVLVQTEIQPYFDYGQLRFTNMMSALMR